MDRSESKVTELISAVLEQMKTLKYSTETIAKHAKVYKQLQTFSTITNAEMYSVEIRNDFLEETKRQFSETRNPRFFEQYHTAINKVDDVYANKTIQSMHRCELPIAKSAFVWCIGPFRQYLRQRITHKGVDGQLRIVAQFLQFAEESGVCSLSDLCPKNIYEGFEKASDKPTYTRAMRHFLKYATKSGLIPLDYSRLVPCARFHKATPPVYTKGEVEQVLAGVDRNTISGKRTYAVLLLCARLGLRISDICNLEFSNICEANERIELVQVKTKTPLELPLLPDVADALMDYIDNARPHSDSPKVFLRLYAPISGMTPPTISYELKRLFDKAGIDVTNRKHGPHSLRSSLASALLDEGNSYPIIQKVLGHNHPSATKHYTKVDIRKLRDCALDVPAPTGKFANYLADGRY